MKKGLLLGFLMIMLGLTSQVFVFSAPNAIISLSDEQVRAGDKIYFDASESRTERGTETGLKYRWKFRQMLNWTKYTNYPWISYIPSFSGVEVAWLEVVDMKTGEIDRVHKTYEVIGNNDQKGFRDWEKINRGGISRHDRKDLGRSEPEFAYSPQFFIDLELRGQNNNASRRGGFVKINDRSYESIENSEVAFSARSEDLTGQSITGAQYRWDFEGDRIWDTAFGSDTTPKFVYEKSGTYYPVVEVLRANGDRSFSWVRFEVIGNTQATVEIKIPDEIYQGKKFVTEVLITDNESSIGDFEVRFDMDSDGVWDQDFGTDKTIDWRLLSEESQEITIEIKDPQGKIQKITKKINPVSADESVIDIHVEVSHRVQTINQNFNLVIDKAEGYDLDYSWKVPEVFGGIIKKGKTLQVRFETPGLKEIELDVTDGFGTIKQVRIPVYVTSSSQSQKSIAEYLQSNSFASLEGMVLETEKSKIAENTRNIVQNNSVSSVYDDLSQSSTAQNIGDVLSGMASSNDISSDDFSGPSNLYEAIERVTAPTETKNSDLPGIESDSAVYYEDGFPFGVYRGPMRAGAGPWVEPYSVNG